MDYEDAFRELSSIGIETQLLEFKAELKPRDVAQEVVAMANSIGGTVVIGIDDPVDGKELTAPASATFATDEPARRKLRSQILARIYPTPKIDVFGFASVDGLAMLVVSVDESALSPNEFTEE